MRAAVTTGEAVVALGARVERGEGIVAGDVVNTAARLQAAAAPGTVIVDETTMRSSDAAIAFEALAPVEAKGKSEPIAIWRAVEARSRVGEAEMTTRTPFVGREHERAVLLESFLRVERESACSSSRSSASRGSGRVGLSRSCGRASTTVPRSSPGATAAACRTERASRSGRSARRSRRRRGSSSPTTRPRRRPSSSRPWRRCSRTTSEREWLASRLGPLVGAGGETGAVGRDEAFTSWRRFLEAMAARRPVVLVVEDLHWADTALLDFLEHVLDWGAPVPLLVLATTRPELYDRRAGWGGGRRNATTISLSPLSADETARLLQGLLERAVLPAETQVALLEKAGGNPLYTEQFASMLSERGDAGGLAVPETVQALIAARLDTLSPELKSLLQDACVVGRSFWTGAVAALGGRTHDDVLAGIRELVRRELVRPARVSSFKGEEEFSIWHALVRDVGYSQIPRAPRSEKHEAAAAWIEEQAQERLADHAEIIVHHYEQALSLSRAAGVERPDLQEALARFLRLAGDNAMRLDIAAAEAAYRRALDLSDDASARGAVLGRLGEALQEQGRLPESEEVYEEALSAYRGAGDERGAAVVAHRVWTSALAARAHGARSRS